MATSELLSETSKWVKGPVFVAFLEKYKVTQIEAPSLNFDYLRKGENISVWRADRILTSLGHHIWELPEDAWMPIGYDPRWRTRKRGGCYATKSK